MSNVILVTNCHNVQVDTIVGQELNFCFYASNKTNFSISGHCWNITSCPHNTFVCITLPSTQFLISAVQGDRGCPAGNSPLAVEHVVSSLPPPSRGQRDCGTISPSETLHHKSTIEVLYLEEYVVMLLTTMCILSGLITLTTVMLSIDGEIYCTTVTWSQNYFTASS